MSTYLGIDVLEVNHNFRDAIRQSFDRLGTFAENPTGRRLWEDAGEQPMPVRSFSWFADGRPAIAALRAFLDARKGRMVPFWIPTYTPELVMTLDGAALDSSVRVANVGYGRFLFPFQARRYLAIISGNGTFLRRKVTLVTDNGDGTETLSLDAGLGIVLPASRTLVSFLVLCRLEDDFTPLTWDGPEHAEAVVRFRELPKEVP